jgi:hypothetical protein
MVRRRYAAVQTKLESKSPFDFFTATGVVFQPCQPLADVKSCVSRVFLLPHFLLGSVKRRNRYARQTCNPPWRYRRNLRGFDRLRAAVDTRRFRGACGPLYRGWNRSFTRESDGAGAGCYRAILPRARQSTLSPRCGICRGRHDWVTSSEVSAANRLPLISANSR